jgi:formate dehydrogenase subunit gamma
MINPRDDSPLLVRRHGAFQRLNHWTVAILFVLLALSGLAMLYPRLFFLTALFGGGEEARQIHPWLGVALSALFFLLAIPIVGDNLWNLDDVRWTARLWDILRNRHKGVPDLGKYNAGQKGVYWMQVLLLPILLASGLVIWEEYFGAHTTIETQRLALLAHSIAALIAITVIVVHVYAAIWISGTLRGMTRGAVTGGWAWRNHRKWFRATAAKMAAGRRTE